MELDIKITNFTTPRQFTAMATLFATLAEGGIAPAESFTGLAGCEDETNAGVENDLELGAEKLTQDEVSTLLSEEGSTSAPASETTAPCDEKGVAFNDEFCGKSPDAPFYGSGKTKGQWKKRRGVEAAAYANWYAAELDGLEEGVDREAADEPLDTAAAFGTVAPTPPFTAAPSNVGELMAWISEQQVAGYLTPADIANGYAAAAIQPQDLFPSDVNTPEVVSSRIAGLFGVLSHAASTTATPL